MASSESISAHLLAEVLDRLGAYVGADAGAIRAEVQTLRPGARPEVSMSFETAHELLRELDRIAGDRNRLELELGTIREKHAAEMAAREENLRLALEALTDIRQRAMEPIVVQLDGDQVREIFTLWREYR